MTTRVIIDCDPGIDDAVALLLALSSPNLIIEGITIVHGNSSDIEKLAKNACTILHIAGRPDIPVHVGAAVPIHRKREVGAEWVHGENCLGDIELPHAKNQPHPHHSAVEFIVSKVKQHPKEIVLITLGPLTNIALALQIYPKLAENVKDLVIMGGAVFTRGNASPCAEANIYHDPEAAKLVFNAKWPKPFTLVPLDITQAVQMTHDEFKILHDSNNKCGVFVYQILKFYYQFHEKLGVNHMYIHDATAVMALLYPELFKEKFGLVDVEAAGDITRGETVFFDHQYNRFQQHNPHAHNAKVIIGGDVEVIKRILLEQLTSLP
jgi:inosine-uridine nucleoside N-ribohydrolase